MRRSTRAVAGIFALVAMTLAVTETVVAATCGPDMDMTMTMASADADAGHAAQGGPIHDASHDREDEAGHDGPECPFGPASVASGCTGTASFPASAATAVAASGASVGAVFIERSTQDLLLVTAPFHPPRA